MDFSFTEEEQIWRQEVREFLRNEPLETYYCEGADEGYGNGAWSNAFYRRLAEEGWIGRTWPKEYGGEGRPITELFILLDEMAYHKAPCCASVYTEAFAIPIVQWGGDELKKKWLPKVVRGEASLWEGYSEPDAGSDLLSLKTTAVEKDDCYVINGQKAWNSWAHLATHGYIVARTDSEAPRHEGLSLFLIDMSLRGITVRPIQEMAGGTSYAEVFFDNVKVAKENLIGGKNHGLPLLLSGLEGDRFWGRMVKASYMRRLLEEVVDYCQQTIGSNGKLLAENPLIRSKLAELAIEIEVCRLFSYRGLSKIGKGEPLTYEASELHIFANEMGQRFFNAVMQMLELYGQLERNSKWAPFNGNMEKLYLSAVGHTLAGGTTELNKNTIARFGLELPAK